ncbi:M14 family metallopeptidase [Croceiramulus getboli]|nr:M14 family metallopeptidase [Flavobacteriaceae bacterium YJPT1-3]
MRILFLLLILVSLSACSGSDKTPEDFDFTTTFEKSDGQQTATYEEIIQFYEDLDEAYTSIKTYTVGRTDSGLPLHLITFNPNRTFDSEFADKLEVTRILINNGIHPGEPDGIDATMMLFRDLANGTIPAPNKVWISAIAVYNIGGALNRNTNSRTNQNGPEAYGFRGNARNYDLNRDFIKADTKNARAFAEIYHMIDPDIFIDNHVSNGADYQYTLTHLFSQHNKLGGELGDYLHTVFQPALEADLQRKDWDITPYVNVFNRTPESGFSQFMDYPRYSTGYTSLWNTLGLMVETHMLKPYPKRVAGTYELMKSAITVAELQGTEIRQKRKMTDSVFLPAGRQGAKANYYPTQFAIDSSQTTILQFKGYEGEYLTSPITGQQRLKYDRTKPFTKPINYYNFFKVTDSVLIPKAYVIPQGWWQVLQRLSDNEIEMDRISKDTILTLEVSRIVDYKTRNRAYEGHFAHYATRVERHLESVALRAGDRIVYTDQPGIRYLLETLEPEAMDSFFNWNFFDTILQQKEGYSPYVWEDLALEFLEQNPKIKQEFERKKDQDAAFSGNLYAQLDWIHKKSPYYEQAHLRYPVFRMLE